jgi:phage FluMu protein Com
MTATNTTNSWEHTVELPVGLLDQAQGRTATLRKMTGNDEAILADPKLRNNAARLITNLLSSCLTSLGGAQPVDVKTTRALTSADRNFLLLELRKLTFGTELECSYKCPRCNHLNRVSENLDEIEIRRPECAVANEITIKLEDGYREAETAWHHELSFVWPTGEDEEAAASRREVNASRQRDALLARCLRRVGSMDPRKVSAAGIRVLAELSMADRRRIQRTLDEHAPGPDLTRTISCEACSEDFRTMLDMTHFFPLA